MRTRRAVVWLLVIAALGCTGVASAQTASCGPETWYWTAAACKSELHHHGMQMEDGLSFDIKTAYCVGKGGPTTCAWNSNYTARMYSRFTAYMLSYDGVVRRIQLTPTGRGKYSGIHLIAYGTRSEAAFSRDAGNLAHTSERTEQKAGCGAPF